MYQNEVLAYKLSYCLGVTNSALAENFGKMNAIAAQSKYWTNFPLAREMRAIYRIYFQVLRKFSVYSATRSFYAVDAPRVDDYTAGVDVDFAGIFANAEDALDFVNKLAEMVNHNLEDLYKQLQNTLDYSLFLLLMKLPTLDTLRAEQISFLLKREDPRYNIHFFGNDVLNAAVPELLRSDLTLRRRLALITGEHVGATEDTSSLMTALLDFQQDAFIQVSDLSRFSRIVVDLISVPESIIGWLEDLTRKSGQRLFRASGIASTLKTIRDNKPTDTLVLCHWTDEIFDNIEPHLSRACFGVIGHIPKKSYKKIIRHTYANTYIFSMRQLDGANEDN